MESLEQARKKLDDEFGQVRRKIGKIRKELEKVEAAGPEDDLHELLADLESTVKEVRDGGVVGSGANGHRRARKKYLELKHASG
jgi:Skp family chaperone for outer membrane proteins